jgi:Cys-rich protein (TIGR01571 family)
MLQPAGGVVAGQRMVVPFEPNASYAAQRVVGTWKDDVFACTRYGLCHPSLINTSCFRFILLGQIMTRLQLDWFANPASSGEWRNTFNIMVYVTLGWTVTLLVSQPHSQFSNLCNFSLFAFMVILVTKVRIIVRQRYEIPESQCVGCEDVCCAFWCSCCTVSQLARQTADYDMEEARFFTNDGLSPIQSAPVMVV